VRSIVEGPDGVIWICTSQGLSKFEANRFTTFQDANGEAWGTLEEATVGADGTLWIATRDKGLWRFDGTRFLRLSMANGLPTNDTSKPHVSPVDGSVWFQVWGHGVARYQPDAGQGATPPSLSVYSTTDGLISNDVESINTDREGNVWIAAVPSDAGPFGLSRLRNGSFVNYATTEKNPLVTVAIRDILNAPDGTLSFATERGMVHYDPYSFVYYGIADGMSHGGVLDIHAETDGPVWFGLGHFDGARGGPVPGLSRFDGDRFTNFGTQRVYAISPSKDGGLFCGQPHNQGITYFDGEEFTKWNSDFLFAIGLCEASDGTLWIADWQNGVAHFDPYAASPSDRLLSRHGNDGFNVNGTTAVYGAPDGSVWAGYETSSPESAGVRRYQGKEFEPVLLADDSNADSVLAIAGGPGDQVWFASASGLLVFDPQNPDGRLVRHPHRELHGQMQSVYEDRQHHFWVGSFQRGVFRFDGVQWQNLDVRDELADNFVAEIGQDGNGRSLSSRPFGKRILAHTRPWPTK
jgi:ligand-binding sensor domain-containing protein